MNQVSMVSVSGSTEYIMIYFSTWVFVICTHAKGLIEPYFKFNDDIVYNLPCFDFQRVCLCSLCCEQENNKITKCIHPLHENHLFCISATCIH